MRRELGNNATRSWTPAQIIAPVRAPLCLASALPDDRPAPSIPRPTPADERRPHDGADTVTPRSSPRFRNRTPTPLVPHPPRVPSDSDRWRRLPLPGARARVVTFTCSGGGGCAREWASSARTGMRTRTRRRVRMRVGEAHPRRHRGREIRAVIRGTRHSRLARPCGGICKRSTSGGVRAARMRGTNGSAGSHAVGGFTHITAAESCESIGVERRGHEEAHPRHLATPTMAVESWYAAQYT
ncbi:hypothetical protein B0H17DRAFT_1084926 [Mycena rosella]|uniref:Uncharacterized protein n=1 Tax=Mycena rosella TaxID=1033263 RepID=A0AAD7D023_MYCRO|nr:hypothetical protein B0H17DRAFT_1084926 [Mycena rosella]